MNCEKPEIEVLLPDYYTGHLAADQEQEVRSHLEECRSCRESLRTMSQISGQHKPLRPEGGKGHFSPQLLSRYYTDPSSLDRAIIVQIEAHIKTCAECSADLKFLQESDKDFRLLARTGTRISKEKGLWERLLGLFKKVDK